MHILWLRPDKPENISVGRHRIGLELEARGHQVEIRDTTVGDFWGVLQESPDVVVGTTRLGAFVGTWRRIMAGTPLLVDHIDPISQLRRSHGRITVWGASQAEKVAFRLADHVMVVYEEELPRVDRHASKVTHTSLGVDYDLFSDPPEDTVAAATDAVDDRIPPDGNVLLYVGGLEPQYHLTTVVEALDHLDNWHFVILGNGSQREQFEDFDDNHENVHYLGSVPYEYVPGYMHVSDVGITLLNDRNTLKVLEYGAAGLPVVHIEGDAEEVFDGMVTFCSLDPFDVARAIQQATGAETEPLDTVARERSWESIADTYDSIIKEILEAR